MRLVEAAIALFAARGMDEVGVRELTAQAGVNLGAINYHFGNKEALAETVFMELAARVNGRRLDKLRRLQEEASAKNGHVSTREVIELFTEPYLGTGPDAEEGRLLGQFVLKHRVTPSAMTQRIIRKHFDPMAKAYIEALSQAAPEIDAAEFFWRYMFMVSAVVLTVSDRSKSNRLARLSDGVADTNRRDELKEALIRFLIGGMHAP